MVANQGQIDKLEYKELREFISSMSQKLLSIISACESHENHTASNTDGQRFRPVEATKGLGNADDLMIWYL